MMEVNLVSLCLEIQKKTQNNIWLPQITNFLQGHKLARGVIGNLFLNVCAQYQKKEENEEEAETDFLLCKVAVNNNGAHKTLIQITNLMEGMGF